MPPQSFPRARVMQAAGAKGVKSAAVLYLEETYGVLKHPDGRGFHPALVIGVNPAFPGLRLPPADLLEPDTAVFDRLSRNFFGGLSKGSVTELNGRRVTIADVIEIGPTFRLDGIVVVSDVNFRRYFPRRSPVNAADEPVELGVLKLTDGADVSSVQRELRALLPNDVAVLTPAELQQLIINYWATFQPIGMIFGVGAAVGLVIGLMICYQVLFTSVHDALPQFATLRAIGHRDSTLVSIIVSQGLLLGLLSFIPGAIASSIVFSVLQHVTGIRMWLTPGRLAMVLSATVVMCCIAALLAGRRVLVTDPAAVFEAVPAA
jgi:putative ABC transport system permease protein